MIETSVRHEAIEVEDQEEQERGRCAACGASGVSLMNGHEKGWDKPFYCMDCNPRFELIAPGFLGRPLEPP